MDLREKLIELCKDLETLPCCDTYEGQADYLIANGVTVQKWIPVAERLPDDSIPSNRYLCCWNGKIWICKYWRTHEAFEYNGRVVPVTHWMPLPEPPKGD